MRVLGIDPGHSGGAVVWDGTSVLQCVEWKRVDNGYRIRTAPRRSWTVADLFLTTVQIGRLVDLETIDVVVLEALYIPRSARGYASVLRAAEARGILSQLHMWSTAELHEPRATQWRKKVFGSGAGNRNQSKQNARRHAKAYPGVTLPKSDHVCEALCLAQYGSMMCSDS